MPFEGVKIIRRNRSMIAFYENRDEQLFIGEMTHIPFPVHVHNQAEILAVVSGTVRFTVDDTEYTLLPGDVAFVFPLTPHSYNEIGAGASGVVAIVPPDIIPEYSAVFRSRTPVSPVLRASETGEDAHSVIRRLHCLDMKENLPLCVAYLHVLLASTMQRLSYSGVYDYSDRSLGHRIMRYISEHLEEDLTQESVSHALGISASHLSHFFTEKLHVNFRQYINTNRMARARLMMRDTGYTLTMIADACGYSNMRTFRRAFLKEFGSLPSAAQYEIRNSISPE